MKEFMLIFKSELNDSFGPEHMQANLDDWMNWFGGLAAQGKIVNANRLAFEGKTLRPNNVITDGPFAELKEIIGGYVVVKAETMDEALKLAEACPILSHGGCVEVRSVIPMKG